MAEENEFADRVCIMCPERDNAPHHTGLGDADHHVTCGAEHDCPNCVAMKQDPKSAWLFPELVEK